MVELAKRLWISVGGLTSGRYKFQQRLKSDRDLAKRVAEVEKQIYSYRNNIK